MPKPDNKYIFILGREREIAREELKAVLRYLNFGFGDLNVTDNIVFANLDRDEAEVAKLSGILGGTTKIFKVLDSPVNTIAKVIRQEKRGVTGKINFGISDYSKTLSKEKISALGLEVKRELGGEFSLRFVANRERRELSTIQSLKNNLAARGLEIGIFDRGIGILIGLSNPEEWARRDYGKPAGDKYSGMAPPKLARTMINIALAQQITNNKHQKTNKSQSPISNTQNNLNIEHSNLEFICDLEFDIWDFRHCVVVDPFCGSGNILMEALMLGCDVIGSDISEKAVADSKANVEWLLEQLSNIKDQLSVNAQFTIFKADATSERFIENCKSKIENYDRFVIVTEPYLGKPKKFHPSTRSVQSEYARIKQLYLDFLKNFAIFGSSGHGLRLPKDDRAGMVFCLVFPLVETADRGRLSLYADSVDEIKNLGYTELRPPLVYGRDYQVVKRQIVFLGFKS